jgi:predicted kinase
VKRVIVVGSGAAGKTTLAARLAEITGLAVIELDKLFWRPGLVATPPRGVGGHPAQARRAGNIDYGRGPRAL